MLIPNVFASLLKTSFVLTLAGGGVQFRALDMPGVTVETIGRKALEERQRRRRISERTKAGLAEAKARGAKLGNPRLAEAQAKARAVHHANRPPREVLVLITEWRREGRSFQAIADELNRLNIRASRDGPWHRPSVRNILPNARKT